VRGRTIDLRVIKADRNDVYRDIARVHHDDRGNIAEGRICKVSVNGRTRLLAVRGVPDEVKGCIRLDDATRFTLGIVSGTVYAFEFSTIAPYQAIVWACKASEPGARIAAWIAVWSVILAVLFGIAGLLIGLWPLITK
jgi:hypothetical protein